MELVLGLFGLGFVIGPMAVPVLIGAVWSGRWSLWFAGSLMLLWGAFAWGWGVAQFAAIDSLREAELLFFGALATGMLAVAACAGGVWSRRRTKSRS